MGRRAAQEMVVIPDEQNEVVSAEPQGKLTSTQRLAVSTASSAVVSPEPFGREAKHFA